MGIRNREESAEVIVCALHDGVCMRGTMGDFSEGHAGVIVVQQVLRGLFEDRSWERGGSGAKVDDLIASGHLCVEGSEVTRNSPADFR